MIIVFIYPLFITIFISSNSYHSIASRISNVIIKYLPSPSLFAQITPPQFEVNGDEGHAPVAPPFEQCAKGLKDEDVFSDIAMYPSTRKPVFFVVDIYSMNNEQ